MHISFWMNHKELREGYTLHYHKEDLESISGNEFPIENNSSFKADLFRTFCNVMSVDYNRLIDRLAAIRDMVGREDFVFAEEEIIFTLRSTATIFLDPDMIFEITNDLCKQPCNQNLTLEESIAYKFEPYALLQQFASMCMEDPELPDLGTYMMLINNVFRVDIPQKILIQESLKSKDYKKHQSAFRRSPAANLMMKFLDSLEQQDPSKVCYLAETPLDVMIASLYEIIRGGYIMKRCEICGKIFVPYNRSDTLYCDRPSPRDKKLTCKQYGSKKLWYEQLKKDEAKSLARNIYQAKQMLVRRNPDIATYATSFETFKVQLKQWKADVKAGKKTDAEYIEWLNLIKGKKVL